LNRGIRIAWWRLTSTLLVVFGLLHASSQVCATRVDTSNPREADLVASQAEYQTHPATHAELLQLVRSERENERGLESFVLPTRPRPRFVRGAVWQPVHLVQRVRTPLSGALVGIVELRI
jgi:hypothetical protein